MYFNFLDEAQKEAILQRLSSFLKWVHTHNPEFKENLTTEEITNVWLIEFAHEPWIEHLIQRADIQFIAHVNEYLHAYASVAHNFHIEFEPKFKEKQSPQVYAPKKDITEKQFRFLLSLTKKHKRNINLNELSKQEARKLIDELLKSS